MGNVVLTPFPLPVLVVQNKKKDNLMMNTRFLNSHIHNDKR